MQTPFAKLPLDILSFEIYKTRQIAVKIKFLNFVSGYNFQKTMYILSEEFFFTLANNVDPDEMPQYAAFHLGLHCL